METGVSERKPRSTRWWLTLAAEIATVVGVLVAIVTLVLEHPPSGDRPSATASANPASTTSTPNPAPPPGGSTAPPGTPTRYLADLDPDTGGGNVQRVGSHSLRMACGTGESDDPYREVSYVLPPAVTYRSFASVVEAAGQRDTRIQALLLIDDRKADDPIVRTGTRSPLGWKGQRVSRLTLRITCDPGATMATFTDPALSG